MRIRFAEAAKDELNDACDWYERQQSGLGARFRSDVREASLLIAKSPLLFPVELEDVRRYVMTRFSYALELKGPCSNCFSNPIQFPPASLAIKQKRLGLFSRRAGRNECGRR